MSEEFRAQSRAMSTLRGFSRLRDIFQREPNAGLVHPSDSEQYGTHAPMATWPFHPSEQLISSVVLG